MKKSNMIYIIIPIHNGIECTLKCLNSITLSSFTDYRVVIVDDGSTDSSAEIIKKLYPETVILHGDGSLWWSGGINKGINYALSNSCSHVMLLNNDNIIAIDTLSELVKSSNTNPDAIVCSLVYVLGSENIILFGGGYFNPIKGGLYIKDYFKHDEGQLLNDTLVEWCGGMGVLIPLVILKEVGLFDQINFPQYLGDADYMYRVRKAGFSVLLNPKSVVWNDRSTTGLVVKKSNIRELLTSNKSNYNINSNLKFYYTHFNILEFIATIVVRYSIVSLSKFKKMILSGDENE